MNNHSAESKIIKYPVTITYKHCTYTLIFEKEMASLEDVLLKGQSVITDFENNELEWLDSNYNPFA